MMLRIRTDVLTPTSLTPPPTLFLYACPPRLPAHLVRAYPRLVPLANVKTINVDAGNFAQANQAGFQHGHKGVTARRGIVVAAASPTSATTFSSAPGTHGGTVQNQCTLSHSDGSLISVNGALNLPSTLLAGDVCYMSQGRTKAVTYTIGTALTSLAAAAPKSIVFSGLLEGVAGSPEIPFDWLILNERYDVSGTFLGGGTAATKSNCRLGAFSGSRLAPTLEFEECGTFASLVTDTTAGRTLTITPTKKWPTAGNPRPSIIDQYFTVASVASAAPVYRYG